MTQMEMLMISGKQELMQKIFDELGRYNHSNDYKLVCVLMLYRGFKRCCLLKSYFGNINGKIHKREK